MWKQRYCNSLLYWSRVLADCNGKGGNFLCLVRAQWKHKKSEMVAVRSSSHPRAGFLLPMLPMLCLSSNTAVRAPEQLGHCS